MLESEPDETEIVDRSRRRPTVGEVGTPRLFALASMLLAITVGSVGWVAIGSVELGANESLGRASTALASVEESLRGSTGTALATADALDGAADSIEAAAAVSDSTAVVANDVSDVTATLPPVIDSLDDSLTQVQATLDQVDAVLESLPFDLGVRSSPLTDSTLTEDLDPLRDDLAEAGGSLERLALDAERLGPEMRTFVDDLRSVAIELRRTTDDLEVLADDVADTNSSLDLDDGEVSLLTLRLLLLGLVAATMLGQVPNLTRR